MSFLKQHPKRWVLLKKALISFLIENPDQCFIFNYVKRDHNTWEWRICHPNEAGTNPTKVYLLRETWWIIVLTEMKLSINNRWCKLKQAWRE